jgi:hypothetical protein
MVFNLCGNSILAKDNLMINWIIRSVGDEIMSGDSNSEPVFIHVVILILIMI